MTEPIRCVPENAIITGWDFSTGAVKCLAFDLEGNTLAEARIPTDLWTANGVAELNLMQLEGQARSITRAIANRLKELGRLQDWIAGDFPQHTIPPAESTAIYSKFVEPSAGMIILLHTITKLV